jgi:hypothetical protein
MMSTFACLKRTPLLTSARSLDAVLANTSRRAAVFELQIKALEVRIPLFMPLTLTTPQSLTTGKTRGGPEQLSRN